MDLAIAALPLAKLVQRIAQAVAWLPRTHRDLLLYSFVTAGAARTVL
jgi:hypothetical protein